MDSRKLDVVKFNALPSISKHRTGRIASERRRSHVRIEGLLINYLVTNLLMNLIWRWKKIKIGQYWAKLWQENLDVRLSWTTWYIIDRRRLHQRFDCNSTAPRSFDDRSPTWHIVCRLLHWGLNKQIDHHDSGYGVSGQWCVKFIVTLMIQRSNGRRIEVES